MLLILFYNMLMKISIRNNTIKNLVPIRRNIELVFRTSYAFTNDVQGNKYKRTTNVTPL